MSEGNPFGLIGEYTIKRSRYDDFTVAMAQLLRNLITASSIEILAVESRTKTSESFSDKVQRDDKAGKYSKLEEITDLSGLRVIAYLREDCDMISKIIEDNFKIDRKNSIEKGASKEDQFG